MRIRCNNLTTNFENGTGQIGSSGGTASEQGLTGVNGLDFSIKGNWSFGQDEPSNPPGIYPQDAFPNLLVYQNYADDDKYVFPFSCILQTDNGSNVRQMVTYSWNGFAQPGWSVP